MPDALALLGRLVLAGHIALGLVTLLLAPAALFATKGGAWHRRLGGAYTSAMLVVCLSAAAVSCLRGSYAMLTITLLAFYLVFSGARAMRPAQARLGTVVAGATLALLVVVCAYASLRFARGDEAAGANLPMGIAAAVYCVVDLARALRGATLAPSARRRMHFTRLILSYVTTVTAFAVTNLGALPPLLTSVGPLAAGVAGIAYLRARERGVRVARGYPRAPRRVG